MMHVLIRHYDTSSWLSMICLMRMLFTVGGICKICTGGRDLGRRHFPSETALISLKFYCEMQAVIQAKKASIFWMLSPSECSRRAIFFFRNTQKLSKKCPFLLKMCPYFDILGCCPYFISP